MKNRFLLLLLVGITYLSADVKYNFKSEFTFPWWRSMNLLNKEPIESDAHNAYIDIYVNDIAKPSYINMHKKFDEGSIIIKPLYTGAKREMLARLVIMMKMPEGYDSENGDWWYGVYDEYGVEGWYQGKIKSCITCHKMVKESDYLFTESVMEDIHLQNSIK